MNKKDAAIWFAQSILKLYENNIPVSYSRIAMLSNLLELTENKPVLSESMRKISEVTGIAYLSVSTALKDFEKIGIIRREEQIEENANRRRKGSLPFAITLVESLSFNDDSFTMFSDKELHWLGMSVSVLSVHEKIGTARISLLLYMIENAKKLSKEVYEIDDIAKDSKIAYATVANALKALKNHNCLDLSDGLFTINLKCDASIQLIALKYGKKS